MVYCHVGSFQCDTTAGDARPRSLARCEKLQHLYNSARRQNIEKERIFFGLSYHGSVRVASCASDERSESVCDLAAWNRSSRCTLTLSDALPTFSIAQEALVATKKDMFGFVVKGKATGRVGRVLNLQPSGKFYATKKMGANVKATTHSRFVEAVVEDISVRSAIDVAYAGIPVVQVEDAWGGDPRDMPDEDLAFFGLSR
jgi:hypothetical protein